MTVVDLSFPLVGTTIPHDHGYLVYAAVTTRIPALHDARWLGIHPVGGRRAEGVIVLGRAGELRVRLPAEHIPVLLPLAGSRLDIGKSFVRLGPPAVWPLVPSAALDARLVLLKLTRPPTRMNADLEREVLDNEAIADRYRAELGRQLEAIDVTANLELCGRRSMTVRQKRLLGYSVRLSGLDAEASVRVQAHGLGGRRALGCGIFRPTRAAV